MVTIIKSKDKKMLVIGNLASFRCKINRKTVAFLTVAFGNEILPFLELIK